jgi:hypothetical protein
MGCLAIKPRLTPSMARISLMCLDKSGDAEDLCISTRIAPATIAGAFFFISTYSTQSRRYLFLDA